MYHPLEADFELTMLSIKSAYLLPVPPIPVNLTNQDVDTEYSEAGHTPTETDYYYEETVPLTDGEVVGQEENPLQVKKKMTHLLVTRIKRKN